MKKRGLIALALAVTLALTAPLSVLADTDPAELPILAEDGRVYVWNVETDAYNQNADLTEKPEIEGNLKPAVMAEEEGYIHPALDVQASGENSAFTVTGDVEIIYESDGGVGITAVQAEKLPDPAQDEPTGETVSAEAVVGGDVTASSSSAADGDAPSAYAVNVRAIEGEVIVVVGNVTASAEATDDGGEYHETAFAKGVQAVAFQGGEADVTVFGDIIAGGDAADGRAGAHGVSAGAAKDGVVNVYVDGNSIARSDDNGAVNPQPDDPEDPDDPDVPDELEGLDGPEDRESRLDYSYTNAVLVIAEDGGTVNVTVAGAARAASAEKDVVAGAVNVTAEDLGTRACVTIGEGAEGQVSLTSYTDSEISVIVEEGGVTSDSGRYGAVAAESDKGNIEIDITGDVTGLDSELHPGYATGMNLNAKNEGTIAADVDGNLYAVADEAPEGGAASAESLVAFSDGGTVEASISGNVRAVASSNGGARADAAGISAQATSQSGLPATVMLEIGGDVEAVANNTDGIADALAVSAAALDKNSRMEIHVQGDVIACNESTEPDVTFQFGTRAIFASALGGGATTVEVDGKATAEAPEDLAFTMAVDAEAEGQGGMTTVQIGEGAVGTVGATADKEAKVSLTVLDGGVDAGMLGVRGEANNGSLVEISIAGDVTVHEIALDPGEAYGASLAALDGGTVKMTLDGDMTAKAEEGDAVGIATGSSGGTVEVVVNGDITATGGDFNCGIESNAAEGAETDIIVDGTVAGRESAVVLVMPETQLGDNVSLTVWELVPNESGAVVSRKEDYGSTEITEDVEAEKAVQYIIRVRADQQGMIGTEGTEEYKGYDVAREGDTVTLRLNIPEGFEIVGAYGDANQSAQLLKDAGGNYYLVVPRGGAVELSVRLQRIETDQVISQPQPETGDTEEEALLTIEDTTGKVTITFYRSGTYEAEYEDGSTESGTFRLADGHVVLINDGDGSRTQMAILPNPDTGLWELAFSPSADPDTVYTFEISPADAETLSANCK